MKLKIDINFKLYVSSFIIISTIGLTAFAQKLEPLDQTYEESISEAKSMPRITSADSANSIESLQKDIDLIINGKSFKSTKIGIAVYSLDTRTYLYEKNIDKPLTPASCTKLVTTFTALETLGHDFKVRTSVYSDSDIVKDSVLYGNLYLVGRGDALLKTADIDSLVLQIYKQGIRRIEGSIFADGSYFDKMTNRKDYSHDKDQVEPLPPITALCLEGNVATILISSSPGPGEPVAVTTVPPSYGFKIYNSCKVRGSKKSKRRSKSSLEYKSKDLGFIDNSRDVDIDLVPSIPIYLNRGDAPPRRKKRSKSSFSVVSRLQKDGYQSITVKGALNPKDFKTKRYHILNSELIAAGALKKRLNRFGITADSTIGVCDLDTIRATNLIAEVGRPIADLIYTTNKESDNYLAEYIFKIIGAEHGEYEDNGKKTREVQANMFKKNGFLCSKCILNDGSGLSRRNLVTPRTLVEILEYATTQPYHAILDTSLSIAGVDGTLRKRMVGTTAEGNLHAKTGTLRNVSALSGYVTTLDNEKLIFSIIFNGNYVYDYKQAENSIGLLLSSFFYFNFEQ
jgi:D-alanyl-D-alanine carboxypeptidase/D-alanyl-D-alanine-endopeptidase (penicillin-binding protein 4)